MQTLICFYGCSLYLFALQRSLCTCFLPAQNLRSKDTVPSIIRACAITVSMETQQLWAASQPRLRTVERMALPFLPGNSFSDPTVRSLVYCKHALRTISDFVAISLENPLPCLPDAFVQERLLSPSSSQAGGRRSALAREPAKRGRSGWAGQH